VGASIPLGCRVASSSRLRSTTSPSSWWRGRSAHGGGGHGARDGHLKAEERAKWIGLDEAVNLSQQATMVLAPPATASSGGQCLAVAATVFYRPR
jgi:hypothetical protein